MSVKHDPLAVRFDGSLKGALTREEIMALKPRDAVYHIDKNLAKIRLRPCDSYSRQGYGWMPVCFRTWGDAHAWLIAQHEQAATNARKWLENAKKAVPKADRALEKCKNMRPDDIATVSGSTASDRQREEPSSDAGATPSASKRGPPMEPPLSPLSQNMKG